LLVYVETWNQKKLVMRRNLTPEQKALRQKLRGKISEKTDQRLGKGIEEEKIQIQNSMDLEKEISECKTMDDITQTLGRSGVDVNVFLREMAKMNPQIIKELEKSGNIKFVQGEPTEANISVAQREFFPVSNRLTETIGSNITEIE